MRAIVILASSKQGRAERHLVIDPRSLLLVPASFVHPCACVCHGLFYSRIWTLLRSTRSEVPSLSLLRVEAEGEAWWIAINPGRCDGCMGRPSFVSVEKDEGISESE
jgi:hypothetical protein